MARARSCVEVLLVPVPMYLRCTDNESLAIRIGTSTSKMMAMGVFQMETSINAIMMCATIFSSYNAGVMGKREYIRVLKVNAVHVLKVYS